MDTFEKMYSRKEVAGLLGVSVDAVKRLRDNGHLKAVRLPKMGGRGYNGTDRYEETEIKLFIERNRQ